MSRYRPGDIIEIATEKGFAYVHLTHEHDSYPPVVRLLRGLHAARPADLAGFAANNARLTAMIPIGPALDRLGLPHVLAGRREPNPADRFPIFRVPIRDRHGSIVYWWLWDGEGLRPVAELEPGQEELPLRDVMTAARLHRELLSGD